MWSIEQPEWTCKIDEGSAGLVSAYWSPDSRHILTTADFQLRITLWSLVNKSVSYIKYPKLPQGGLVFTKDGLYMALAERRDTKDYVSIFNCDEWSLLSHFEVATNDLAGLSWSPDGRLLCVWDSIVHYNVLVYSIDGKCVCTYSPHSGPHEYQLGVKCVSWSPTGQFLAIGSFNEKIHVLNNVTWKPVAEYTHSSMIEDSRVVVYSEVEKKAGVMSSSSAASLVKAGLQTSNKSLFPVQSKYETLEVPVSVPSLKPDPEKPNPKQGVSCIRFSSDGRYIASLNENMPSTVWIWDITKLSLSIALLQSSSIKDFKWDPLQTRLAVCTNTNRLYLWSPAGCVSVVVPSDPPISVLKLAWNSDGNAIILKGQTHYSVCYLRPNELLGIGGVSHGRGQKPQ